MALQRQSIGDVSIQRAGKTLAARRVQTKANRRDYDLDKAYQGQCVHIRLIGGDAKDDAARLAWLLNDLHAEVAV